MKKISIVIVRLKEDGVKVARTQVYNMAASYTSLCCELYYLLLEKLFPPNSD